MPTGLLLFSGIVSLVFGIIIMIFPKILNYLIGAWFIIVGVIVIVFSV